QEAYQRDDLLILSTNRWLPIKFSYEHRRDSLTSPENLTSCGRYSQETKVNFPPASSDMALYINDIYMPLDKAVLFTYQNGKAAGVETLTMADGDGLQRLVQLPVGQTLRRVGIPTVSTLVVTNQLHN